MTNNEQVRPVKESPLKRVSRALLPVFLVVGGFCLFQPHLGLVSGGINDEFVKGINFSWKGLLSGERHGLAVGGVFNAEGRLTRVSTGSW